MTETETYLDLTNLVRLEGDRLMRGMGIYIPHVTQTFTLTN